MSNYRHKHLYCIYSKRTKRQLSEFSPTSLKQSAAALLNCCSDQYGIAEVVLKTPAGSDAWQFVRVSPEMKFVRQFLSNEQVQIIRAADIEIII